MSESEETEWRLNTEADPEDTAAAKLEGQQQKEQLQKTVQANVEDIGGGGEGSLVTKPQEMPLTEATKKQQHQRRKTTKNPHKTTTATTNKKEANNSNLVAISKQLEKQANQLVRIERIIHPLQKSLNKMDKQSNTIRQLYTIVIQFQRQMQNRPKFQQQQQRVQQSSRKKKVKGATSSKN